jgi:hypothetical protein
LEISRASLASSSAESAVDSFAPLRRPAKAISAIAPPISKTSGAIDNFLIAVAKANALAHQHPQVARERCLGIID